MSKVSGKIMGTPSKPESENISDVIDLDSSHFSINPNEIKSEDFYTESKEKI